MFPTAIRDFGTSIQLPSTTGLNDTRIETQRISERILYWRYKSRIISFRDPRDVGAAHLRAGLDMRDEVGDEVGNEEMKLEPPPRNSGVLLSQFLVISLL